MASIADRKKHSAEVVQCKHCEQSLRRDSLAAHMQRKHGAIVAKEQPTLDACNFFATKRMREENECDQVQGEVGTRGSDCAHPSQATRSGPTHTCSTSAPTKDGAEAAVVAEEYAKEVKDYTPNSTSTGFLTANFERLWAWLARLGDDMRNATLKIKSLQGTLESLPSSVASRVVGAMREQEAKEQSGLSALDRDINTCLTIQELCDKCDLVFFTADDKLCCSACFDHGIAVPKGILGGNNRGTLGTFDHGQEMKNLKQSVKAHMKSAAHGWCVEHRAQRMLERHQQRSVGITIARLAYMVVREAWSYASFERLVLEQHLLHMFVGTKNHNRKFVPDFLDSMHAVMVTRIKRFLQTVQESTKRKHEQTRHQQTNKTKNKKPTTKQLRNKSTKTKELRNPQTKK